MDLAIKLERRRFAKVLKRCATSAELALKDRLHKGVSGSKFIFQRPLNGYIVDFFSPSCNLIIEVDGGYHIPTEQRIKDQKRQAVLECAGFMVIRFTNEQVLTAIDVVMREIKRAVKAAIAQKYPQKFEHESYNYRDLIKRFG